MSARGGRRGVEVLGRVREIRERDSLIGLQRSAVLLAEHERVADEAHQDLQALPAVRAGAAEGFLAHRDRLARAALLVQLRRTSAHDSAVSTDEARRRWQSDRVRLRTIERLLERRGERERAERVRAEIRMLDEVSEQMHRRAHRVPAPREGS